MASCDFRRSLVTFVAHQGYNNARIQIEARCEITDTADNSAEDYFLVASCKGEDTPGSGEPFANRQFRSTALFDSPMTLQIN